jgi:uncharacterized protein (DUF305 family)
MQINVTKKNIVISLVIGLFAFAAGFMISHNDEDSDMMGMSGMNQNTTSSNEFNAAEIHFAQMMIPHHQQAVEMSDLALKNSKDSAVIELAKQIKAAQAPEIEQMKSWLTKSGFDPNAPHNMMMAGMLSDAEISKLKQSKASAFDKLFLAGMIKHHEGALQMLTMISGSTNDEVKTLSENIASTQTIEIETMKAMLASK